MKKRSLIIFVALALVPLIVLAQISSPGSYSSVIMSFLRSTTAAAARTAIGAANSGSGGELTNSVIYGSTSGNLTMTSSGSVGIGTTGPLTTLHVKSSSIVQTVESTTGASFIQFYSSATGTNSTNDGLTVGYNSGAVFINREATTMGWGNSGATQMTLSSVGLLGVGTTGPEKSIDINSATGACLQLTYNDNNGSAANKVTFDVSSGGDLTVAPSGSDASFTGRLASTPTSSTLAAAATAIAVTANVMTITGDAGANTVATITGGLSGQLLTLIFTDSLVTITDDATATANTVNLSAAFTSTSNDTLTLVFNGTSWREVARSVN